MSRNHKYSARAQQDLNGLAPGVVLINIQDVRYDNMDRSQQLFKKYIQRIRESKLSDINKKIFLGYLRYKQAEGVSYRRLTRIVQALFPLFMEFNYKDFSKITQEDAEEMAAWINEQEKWSDWTKYSNIHVLKNFLTWLRERYNVKVDPSKIKAKEPRNSIMPEYLLTEEEFNKLFNATDDIQMRTLLGILYESGARIGEILNLKIKNVEFNRYGAKLIVKGKTGQRVIPIIWYAGLLRQHIEIHPLKDDPEAPLFYQIDNGILEPISYNNFRKKLKKLCKKVGIKKKIYPHLFRHTRLTELAKKLPEQTLKALAGWVQNSKMARVYVHLSQRDIEEILLTKVYGLKPAKEEEDGKKICPRCGEMNPSNAKLCWRYRTPLDEKEVIERIISEDEIDKWAEVLLEFFRRLEKKDPGIWREMAEIIKNKSYMNILF